MDEPMIASDLQTLRMIDELRKRGAYHIKIGVIEAAFNAATTPVEIPEVFKAPEKDISPEQLDALLYEETLRL